ncbi:ABC transporter substrate-binding protein [Nakamurella antarctica]|uniref:ABC transporter substrate-binding protein n=1 Tax=Nakamurella antarctica TaxID=1902245 RepID=A0A3G8ZL17_9ACTN|nr:ABC transporter substrate-binding protein [Nakamurella antarctica]AZI57535.1 ABC transporter substrate-binding protein [Nakamurella antarctica]
MLALPGRRKHYRLIAAVAAVAIFVSGCSGSSDAATSAAPSGAADPQQPAGSSASAAGTSAGVAQAGGTITFGRTQAPTSLDLHNQITANNAFAIDKIFESLVSFDADGALEPWLASKYESSADGLTWTFTLRDGVTFSNGAPLTPADVVFSLNRHFKVGGPLPLAAPITSIAAEGANTVVIKLSAPYTPFLAELAGFSNGILPADFGGVAEDKFFLKPVGTGPFVVATWDQGGDLTFTANKKYWQPGKPYVDSLIYRLVPEDTQLIAQLQGGQVNAIDQVSPANVAELESNSKLAVSNTPGWEIETLFFNNLDTHFSDRFVRRAVSYALDRQGLVQATSFGTATVAGSLLPPTIPDYNAQTKTLNFNVDAAQKELKQSAFPDGFSTKLMVASGNSKRAQEAQIIQAALAEINIKVEIESIDLAAFRERFRAFDYSMMINSALSDVADPNGIISFQADPDAGTNAYWTHYNNPEVTALIQQGRTKAEGPDRAAIYAQIQDLIAGDAPYIPLAYTPNIKATSATVHGLVVLPNGSVRFQDAWISK